MGSQCESNHRRDTMSDKQSRQIKAQLVRTRDIIAKKFRKLHNDRTTRERQLAVKYAPITGSIDKLIDRKEKVLKENKRLYSIGSITTPSRSPAQRSSSMHTSVHSDFGGNNNNRDLVAPSPPPPPETVKIKEEKPDDYTSFYGDDGEVMDVPDIKSEAGDFTSISDQHVGDQDVDMLDVEYNSHLKKPYIEDYLREPFKAKKRSRDDDNYDNGDDVSEVKQRNLHAKRKRIDPDRLNALKKARKQLIAIRDAQVYKRKTPTAGEKSTNRGNIRMQKPHVDLGHLEKVKRIKKRLQDIRKDGLSKFHAKRQKPKVLGKNVNVKKKPLSKEQKKKNERLQAAKKRGVSRYGVKKKKKVSVKKPKKVKSATTTTIEKTKIFSPEDYDERGKHHGHVATKRRKMEIPEVNGIVKDLPSNKPYLSWIGEGLEKDFIPYTQNIAYEYYDDPNELCDRLKLLVSSKAAGNSNHDQEINSIIEELRENGILE